MTLYKNDKIGFLSNWTGQGKLTVTFPLDRTCKHKAVIRKESHPHFGYTLKADAKSTMFHHCLPAVIFELPVLVLHKIMQAIFHFEF